MCRQRQFTRKGQINAGIKPLVMLVSVPYPVSVCSFYNDFGPLNEAVLFRYCEKLKKKLASSSKRRLLHYTGLAPQARVNAAYLVGSRFRGSL